MSTIEWACPRCKATHEHCNNVNVKRFGEHKTGYSCSGFICECECEDPSPDHGTAANPCPTAVCHHCEWRGVFPPRPRKLLAWEKKAIDAGWTPPDNFYGPLTPPTG